MLSETDLNKPSKRMNDREKQTKQSILILLGWTGSLDFLVTHQFRLCLDLGLNYTINSVECKSFQIAKQSDLEY